MKVLVTLYVMLSTSCPVLVYVSLVLELLSQILEPLESHHLGEQPFFEGLLRYLETLPGLGDVLNERIVRIGQELFVLV